MQTLTCFPLIYVAISLRCYPKIQIQLNFDTLIPLLSTLAFKEIPANNSTNFIS